MSHWGLVDPDLVGQTDHHQDVPLLLGYGEKVAVEPSPGGKMQGCRVWEDYVGWGGGSKMGVVPDLAAVPPVVEGSGFGRLGEHSDLL